MVLQSAPEFLANKALQLENVGIVVRSANEAAKIYRGILSSLVTDREVRSGQGTAKVYVALADYGIELIEPTTEEPPIKDIIGDHNASDFTRSHPGGGIHRACFSVADLSATRRRLYEPIHHIPGRADSASGSEDPIDPATPDGVLIRDSR